MSQTSPQICHISREYKKTVVERIKRDQRFAKALYAEAVNAILDGETGEGLFHAPGLESCSQSQACHCVKDNTPQLS